MFAFANGTLNNSTSFGLRGHNKLGGHEYINVKWTYRCWPAILFCIRKSVLCIHVNVCACVGHASAFPLTDFN